MKNISVDAFREILDVEKNNQRIDFINVCEPTEYRSEKINGVRNVPLGEIDKHLEEFSDKEVVYVHCRSGNRSQKAIEKMELAGVRARLVNVNGGLLAWNEAGFETTSEMNSGIPLIRQVFLVAGLLVLVGILGFYFVSETFLLLVVLVGGGLTFSGLTGHCGMALFLSKMPWNK
ncbi:MAG: rhodanese-like domain-containing protein [Candidatus Paceibacterota bacterium]